MRKEIYINQAMIPVFISLEQLRQLVQDLSNDEFLEVVHGHNAWERLLEHANRKE